MAGTCQKNAHHAILPYALDVGDKLFVVAVGTTFQIRFNIREGDGR